MGAPPLNICGNGLQKNGKRDLFLAGNNYCLGLGGLYGGVPNGDFTPTKIVTLGWWDPSDTSPTNIIESGGFVSQLTDIGSSKLQHLVQGSGGSQLITNSVTINSLNALLGDGSQFLERLSFPTSSSGNLLCMGVFFIDDPVNNEFSGPYSYDNINDFQMNANDAAEYQHLIRSTNLGVNGSEFTPTTNFAGSAHIFASVFDFTGAAEFYGRVDGADSLNKEPYTTKLDSDGDLRLMANRFDLPIAGRMGEFIVTEDLSAIENIENYLSNKWGVAI